MYERVLDKDRVANEVVDIIRSTTNAPLADCIQAAKLMTSSLSGFVRDANFEAICSALEDFKLNLDECYDSQLLDALGHSLADFFKEKEELSYSVSDTEETMVDYLNRFTCCIEKTDKRILHRFLSQDDFSWLGFLIKSYQMDQNFHLQLSVLKCLEKIAANCNESLHFFMESQLPIIIVSKLTKIDIPLTEFQCLNIRLLTDIYNSGLHPPLDHFAFLDGDIIGKILAVMPENPDLIVEFLGAFNAAIPDSEENSVLIGLRNGDSLRFGELFINAVNKNYGVNILRLLLTICRSEKDLLQSLFYSNDLEVLSRVLARELINSEIVETRQICFDCIKELVHRGIFADTTREAVQHSSLNDEDKEDLLALLSNN